MGNELTQYQKRMSPDNWDFLLTMLIRTSEKLIMKRRMDRALVGAEYVRQPRIDIFTPGTSGNVAARIRPFVKPNYKPKSPRATMRFGLGDSFGTTMTPALLENLPESWTMKEIRNTRKVLKKMREDSRQVYEYDCYFKDRKKADVFPPKPPPGTKYGKAVDWTAFGFCPKSNPGMKSFIDDFTKDFPYERIEENAVLYRNSAVTKISGRIFPAKRKDAENKLISGEILNKDNENVLVPPMVDGYSNGGMIPK